MKHEDKWKVEASNQWRMPDTALRKPHDINTGVQRKSLGDNRIFFFFTFFFQCSFSVSVCWGKIVLNVFITERFLAEVNPFI